MKARVEILYLFPSSFVSMLNHVFGQPDFLMNKNESWMQKKNSNSPIWRQQTARKDSKKELQKKSNETKEQKSIHHHSKLKF